MFDNRFMIDKIEIIKPKDRPDGRSCVVKVNDQLAHDLTGICFNAKVGEPATVTLTFLCNAEVIISGEDIEGVIEADVKVNIPVMEEQKIT